jgi:hypothetical protein
LAAQLWPTFLMMRDSFTRGGALPWEYVVRGSLGPRDLILLLQPGVFGPPRDLTFYWNPGEASYSEACSFITVWAPFALAAAGFALLGPWRPGVGSARDRLHRRLYLGALAVAIAGALLALGRNSPPSRFIFQHLFGLNFFRVPARYMFWFTVGISVASALALDAWTRPALARRRRRLGGAIAAVGLCLAAIAILLIYVRRMDLWIAWGNPAFSAGNAQLRGAVERALSSNLLTFTARSLGFLVLGALALFAAMRVRTAAWALPLLAAAELGTLNWAIQDVTPVNRYRAAFYENQPQAEPPRSARSPVVAFMRQARSDRGLPLDGGRALWLDDLRYWQVDQNQPEITSNGLVMHGMAQARGYDPINSWWIVMWLNRMAGRDPLEDPGGYASVEEIAAPGMLALGGIDSVVSHRDLSPNLELAYALQLPLDPANDWIPDEPHFPEMRPHDYQPNTIGEGRLGVWMNPDFMGIAFAAPAGAVVDDASLAQETTAKALAAGAAPLEAVVYDSRILESGLQLTDAVDAGFVVRSIEGGPNVFRFEIEFPEPAALYFAQSAYPGWRATIDGHRAPIARACGTFMAVAVDAGRRSVEFRYAPPAGWGWAIAIGLMAAGIVGGAIGLEALKRKLLESIRADRGGVNPGPSAGPAD